MYVNTGTTITNTPSQDAVAAYNTWQYYTPYNNWYQSVPYYYTDQFGKIQKWDSWSKPRDVYLAGGQYKGTPTRTGGFYLQNTVPGRTC